MNPERHGYNANQPRSAAVPEFGTGTSPEIQTLLSIPSGNGNQMQAWLSFLDRGPFMKYHKYHRQVPTNVPSRDQADRRVAESQSHKSTSRRAHSRAEWMVDTMGTQPTGDPWIRTKLCRREYGRHEGGPGPRLQNGKITSQGSPGTHLGARLWPWWTPVGGAYWPTPLPSLSRISDSHFTSFLPQSKI